MPRLIARRRLVTSVVVVLVLAAAWWSRDVPPESGSSAPRESGLSATNATTPPPRASETPSETAPSSHSADEPDESDSTHWPGLTEIQPNVFVSPAGLEYREGSAEGHRLTHLMRHAEDDPDRPIHGVFDGTRDEILALLDEVWQSAQTRGPPHVDREQQGRRTVYTVQLGRKIGFVGGKSGARRGYPPCQGVKLVVEGDDVITAYPVEVR